MTEETSGTQVAEAPSVEQVAQVKTEESPQTFIDAEGKFTQGWKEHYLPEEMRADKVFDTFSDVPGSLKMLGSLQGMIGKKGVIIPGEASTETEWDNFHRELGRPDTKDLYEMTIPEDLAEHYNENFMAKAREMFFELGFNSKQVAALTAFEEERVRAILKTNSESAVKATLDMENFYKEEYKADWEIMVQRSNRLIADNTDSDEEQQALLDIIGNNPIVGKFLGTMSKKFQEHRVVTDSEQPGGMSPSEALTEAKKIESTPGFLMPDDKGQLMKDVNITEYTRLEKERDKFYKIANK